MNIQKISTCDTNFQRLNLKKTKNLLCATAAATALIGAISNLNAQDVPRYSVGTSRIGYLVRYEDYKALEQKYQNALVAKEAYENTQAQNFTNETYNYYNENTYINQERLKDHFKSELMGNSILEGIGFFILGAIGGFAAKIFGKD